MPLQAVLEAAMLTICILFFLSSVAFASERVALLIGNSNYQRSEMSLKNPVNDVAALDLAFRDLGFTTKLVRDGSRQEMLEGLDWLSEHAHKTEMALVFYAGHGVQLGGRNYLVGRDLEALNVPTLVEASLELSEITATLEDSNAELGIVILDACRDNPFANAGMGLPGLASARGGSGLLVAYATDPGNVAYDGVGENSVFAKALLRHLATPQLDIRLMFGRVRQEVVMETNGRQIPWVEESVLGAHFLASKPSQSTTTTDDIAAWRVATQDGTKKALEKYLNAFPNGLFQSFAEQRLRQETQIYTQSPSATTVISTMAESDLKSVDSALSLLGYSGDYSNGFSERTATTRAFSAWQRSRAAIGQTSAKGLFSDAARASMFLAATTAQRIRTDAAVRRSIASHLSLAEVDVERIRELAVSNDQAKALLPEVEDDLKAIAQQLERVARRLDQSLSYYQLLVRNASEHFPGYVSRNLFWAQNSETRGGIAQPEFFRDASLFVEHVQSAATRAPGSQAWMSDFLVDG